MKGGIGLTNYLPSSYWAPCHQRSAFDLINSLRNAIKASLTAAGYNFLIKNKCKRRESKSVIPIYEIKEIINKIKFTIKWNKIIIK